MKCNLCMAAAAALLVSASSTALAAPPFIEFNAGVDLGYRWGDANQTRFDIIGVAPPTLTQLDAELDGWSASIHVGNNWRINPTWLVGIEGTWGYSDISGDDGGSGNDVNGWYSNWEAALLAKVGVLANPNTMIYVTGGWAWGDFDGTNEDLTPDEVISTTFSGWTLGVGAEFILGTNMTGRVQYRYTDYSSENVNFPISGYYIEAGPTVGTLSIGLNWYL